MPYLLYQNLDKILLLSYLNYKQTIGIIRKELCVELIEYCHLYNSIMLIYINFI